MTTGFCREEQSWCRQGDHLLNDRRASTGMHPRPRRGGRFCLWCRPAPPDRRQRHLASSTSTQTNHAPKRNGNNCAALRNSYAEVLLQNSRTIDINTCGQLAPNSLGHQNKVLSPGGSSRRRRSQLNALQTAPEAGKRASGDHVVDGANGASEDTVVAAGFCVAPKAFFCSWECARRWNAHFSPVQTRHERGLRIDVAAGRIVR